MKNRREENKRSVAKGLKTLLSGIVLVDEPLHHLTTYNIGGPADLLVLPFSRDDVEKTVRYARDNRLPLFLLGGGSNVLIPDEGVRGIVIRLGENFSRISLRETRIHSQAGASLALLGKAAEQASLGGLEFSAGIPGTLGGALYMNAGAFREEIYGLVETVSSMSPEGVLRTRRRSEIKSGYRSTSFMDEKEIILEAELRLERGEPEEIAGRAAENLAARKRKQPWKMASAGSVFKKSGDIPAGKFIDECGLKGFKVGDAEISEVHANFIINKGRATAMEVKELIRLVEERVFQKEGTRLEREIVFFEEEARIL